MLDTLLGDVVARGRTVVMTSHNLDRAANLAQRIDILSKGVIAASVKSAEIDPLGLSELYHTVTHV
jgi:heme exporter protein A